jgi:diacylglycerol kinase (ATP)
MPVGQRALFMVNRYSRLGETDLSASIETLQQQGLRVRERLIDRPGEIGETIRRERDQVDLVVLAGGDGTMNAAAEALVETGLPLGIVPLGTGNDLARTLEIPTEVSAALAVIGEGRRHLIDLGRVNGRYFFNVASVGLSAELTRYHTVERKRRWWLLAYAFSVKDAWRSTRPFRARMRCDGRPVTLRAIQIAVGNGRYYGGGMTVSEDAAIDDAKLDVYCLKPLGFWRLLVLFPALRRGRLKERDEALVMSGREIELRTRRQMPVNTDGELTTRTPARFTVVRQAISVFVPATYHGAGQKVAEHAAT